MASRTADGKHTKRFIIEVSIEVSLGGSRWKRSLNGGLTKAFATREDAQAALSPDKGYASEILKYRIRQK